MLKTFNAIFRSFGEDQNGLIILFLPASSTETVKACIRRLCEDITWAIEQIDPDWIVPIHTEAKRWFEESLENVFSVEEG